MSIRVPLALVALAVSAAIGMSLASAPAFAKGSGKGSHGGGHGYHGGHHGHGKHLRGGGHGWGYCDDYKRRAHLRAMSENPMVWNSDQWRSTLMPGYAGGYACAERKVMRVEIERVITVEHTDKIETPRPRARPLVRVVGGADNPLGANAALVRKKQPQCGRSGPMILVWDGAKAERACAPVGSWRGRIIVPSTDLSLDKG